MSNLYIIKKGNYSLYYLFKKEHIFKEKSLTFGKYDKVLQASL